MKNGICPKCNSEEVYSDGWGNHGIVLQISALAAHTVLLYVCADCGYLEFYAQAGHDLQKIREKFQKVKK